MYLDNIRVLGVQEAHQVRQDLGPAHNRVPGVDGGYNCSESVANIGIGISDVTKGQGLDILQDVLPDIAAVHLNVGLEQKSSNQAGRRKLLRHLGQDVDKVVVVIRDISERLQLLMTCKGKPRKGYVVSSQLRKGGCVCVCLGRENTHYSTTQIQDSAAVRMSPAIYGSGLVETPISKQGVFLSSSGSNSINKLSFFLVTGAQL
jgi:hypothetical protein